MADIWKYYRVRLDFTTNLCASVPGNPELVKGWLEAHKPKVRPPGGKSIDEIQEEVFETLSEGEDLPEPSILVFQKNPTNGHPNLVVRASTLRAHMKDCAGVISRHLGKIMGEKTFNTKVRNYLYHDEKEYWIPILRPDGSFVMENDGQREKPIHVTDPRGRPMNAIKIFQTVYPARLDFTIKVFALGKEAIPLEDLETLFQYGAVHGYGGERSDGEGRYTYAIIEMEDRPSKGEGAAAENVAAK